MFVHINLCINAFIVNALMHIFMHGQKKTASMGGYWLGYLLAVTGATTWPSAVVASVNAGIATGFSFTAYTAASSLGNV